MEPKDNNDLEKLISDFTDCFYKAMDPVLEALKKIIDQLSTTFLKAWEKSKFSMNFFDTNITRKRFIKLLMSAGYQRNEANKIAKEVREEKGKYTILDFCIKSKEMEDQKCG